MNVDKLRSLLDYCARGYDKVAVKAGSRTAVAMTAELLLTARSIAKELGIDENSDLKVTVSYGAGYFPKCLWIGIVPKGRAVSNSISVCVCLGPRGDGIVLGSMFPQPRLTGQYKTINRRSDPNVKINLNLRTAKKKYENCFLNPIEMTREELNGTKIIEHLRDSISILREYLDHVESLVRK